MTTEAAETFDLQPVLDGERLTVRPIEASDWDDMFAAASDPKIWAQHPASDRYTEPVFRAYFDEALQSGSAFAFIDRSTGQVIGSSRYHGLDANRSEIEIGWTFLTRDYWGGSYNREIKQLMLDHAFRFVDTVVFWVGADNLRSRRAVEKIGGVQRGGIVMRGGGSDDPHVVFAIRKSDWG